MPGRKSKHKERRELVQKGFPHLNIRDGIEVSQNMEADSESGWVLVLKISEVAFYCSPYVVVMRDATSEVHIVSKA